MFTEGNIEENDFFFCIEILEKALREREREKLSVFILQLFVCLFILFS